MHPEDLPSRTILKICEVYIVDYCCFGFELPSPCAKAGLACDDDDDGMLQTHWKVVSANDEAQTGKRAHVYHSEAVALRDLKKSLYKNKKR